MNKRASTQISVKSRIGALICSVLIVFTALAFIVHGDVIVGYLNKLGANLSNLGFVIADRVEPGELELHFIDVGQGDAILVRTDDTTLLIDCGTGDSEAELITYLRSLRIRKLDCVVLTHPHEDHIGGADKVLDSFKVGRLIMPETDEQSTQLDKLTQIIDKRGITLEAPQLGAVYLLGELSFIPLAPEVDAEDNNASIVLRLEFGELSFLFTGDAELESELAMLTRFDGDERYLLDCDLLKLGHHGSSTSTGEQFLDAVTPEWIVISCGKDNTFGHPHREILDRLEESGIPDDRILRTDKSGTIVISTFGEAIELLT